MQFVTLQRPGYIEPGVIFGDQVMGLRGSGFNDLVSVVSGGPEALDRVKRYAEHPRGSELIDRDKVTLLAPIPRPTKIICVGLNYRDHAEESNLPIPEVPTIFSKFPTAVIGPGRPIVLPKNSQKPDYEAEFAFVIGIGGRHIPESRWREHVFGYTIVNDVSARDYQMATTQWTMGKTFDTFAPIGPAIVTVDEIENPHDLDISLTVNGEELQHSNTRNLIFNIPKLVAFLSSVFTLEPGDIVSTGTPAGVGAARKPPRWLKAGDTVAVKIQGIGELINPVVAEQ
ncbi:MAG TPA: fumarylacetoacetate hydrolase family protein [Bryobacteraceae bacterium]|nr:fumarylacetoacetate hydrolase family protein [Bryobacteraceae bacterium]